MTRRTRPEVERLNAISHAVNRVSGSARDILLFVAVGMALGVAAIVYALTAGDVTMTLGGAGIGAVLGIVYVLTLSWDLAKAALVMSRRVEADGGTVGRIAPNAWITAADGWTWDSQRDYLIDVRDGRARFSQRGAAEYGYEAEAFNALLSRMVLLGLYETNNADRLDNRNGGTWTEEGRDMLRYLDNSDD